MRIALLEDEPIQMQLMVARLETMSMANDQAIDCAQFTDGESLRAALLTDTFDLLILDWNFDRTNGLDLVRWMREERNGRADETALAELPVIVVSARANAGDAAAAVAGGASDYLTKPFLSGELLDRIEHVMKMAPRRQNPRRTPIESSHAPAPPPTACAAGS